MGVLDKVFGWLGLGQDRQADGITENERNEILTDLAEPDSHRLEDYARAERYYDGDHQVRLTDRERQYLQRSGVPWSENFCETIVDTYADRLNVTGFLCEDNEPAQEWADEYFAGDAIAEVAGTVHTNTPMKGDGFLGVDWDSDRGEATMHWNDPACCVPIYNAAGELLMVAKTWNEAAPSITNPTGKLIKRLNLYLPDRIEKWFSWAGHGQLRWLAHMDADDPGWPTPWVRNDGTPRGVGIIHFRHKPKGKDYGRSILRSAIPQQDYLNKQLIDLANVMDNQGHAQRHGTGISDKAAAGLHNEPGTLWTTPNENAKFGQFDAADVEPMLKAIEGTLRRMAGRSKVPVHLLIAGLITQLPSGESLKTSEAALTFAVKDCHPTYGSGWSREMALVAGLEADFGTSGLVYAGESFDTQWQDPTSRNELAELEVAQAKGSIGVSQTTLLEEAGYDPEQEAERRREEAKERQAEFDAGRVPPGPDEGDGGNPDEEGGNE